MAGTRNMMDTEQRDAPVRTCSKSRGRGSPEDTKATHQPPEVPHWTYDLEHFTSAGSTHHEDVQAVVGQLGSVLGTLKDTLTDAPCRAQAHPTYTADTHHAERLADSLASKTAEAGAGSGLGGLGQPM